VRAQSTATVSWDEDEAAWEAEFIAATEAVYDSTRSFQASAAGLRQLIQTGLLRHTDLRDRPDRFFKAHRLLARHAVKHGPGFWIRFTVHYNLCFGTVLAVGSPEQVESMEQVTTDGLLGCFALTEKLAGVQSGLIVQTKAEYKEESQTFELNNLGKTEGAYKNWISQGFVADKAVVLADLTVGGERKGPHAFLMDMRKGGELQPGVATGDMGIKTVGNDLDNAWISFDRVQLPRSALLSRYAQVSPSGEYQQTQKGIKPFEMIGQRLYTGRVAVAQAALSYQRQLYEDTRAYADAKPIPSFGSGGSATLASIPQLYSLFDEAESTTSTLEDFVGICEEWLTPHLLDGSVPSDELAHMIAVAKVKAVEHSIDLCWRLKQEVGSYALMGDSGFGSMDFLQCCKFAEGDSRVLMLKMARDRMRKFTKDRKTGLPSVPGHAEEESLCVSLATMLAKSKGDKAVEMQLWDQEWRTVYSLAEAVMARTMDQTLRGCQ
jgi:alkylation response protein AidB-like acyl-CoA dehydrogenase